MYRKEDIPSRVRLAVLMLIALLMLSMEQDVIRSFFFDTPSTSVEVEKQLTIKQSLANTNNLGIIHDDSQLTLALILALSFLLILFPSIKEKKLIRFAPIPLSRNFCCIVPKGP